MDADGDRNVPPDDPVRRYKTALRDLIDRRPSGLRGRLARTLGKHKSFVSQITSPNYAVPVPATDLATIFAVCHFSAEEKAEFLALYDLAHPSRGRRQPQHRRTPNELRIALPTFRDETVAREVESLVLEFAARVIRLAERTDGVANDQSLDDQEENP
ncbi:MAG: hypothetical protein AAFX81_13105 [Pseudomonadota bacterium]